MMRMGVAVLLVATSLSSAALASPAAPTVADSPRLSTSSGSAEKARLAVKYDHNPLIAGEVLVLRGRVRGISGGTSVEVQAKRKKKWVTIGTGATKKNGSFKVRGRVYKKRLKSYVPQPVRPGRYAMRVKVAGARTFRAPRLQVVEAQATISGPPTVGLGQDVPISVAVTPARPGQRVSLSHCAFGCQQEGSAGRELGVAKQDSRGVATFQVRRDMAGKWILRARGSDGYWWHAERSWLPIGAVRFLGQARTSVEWEMYGGTIHAKGDGFSYYTDPYGRLVVVEYDGAALHVTTLDPVTGEPQGTPLVRPVADFPIFGGFLAAPDGTFYVVVGRPNENENPLEDVVAVLRYDAGWNPLGAATLRAGVPSGGIQRPFDLGTASLAMVGGRLVVHMGRRQFVAADGLNHLSNLTFEVDPATMTATTFAALGPVPYASHSWGHLAAVAGSSLVLTDLADAYPRALRMHVFDGYPSSREMRQHDLMTFASNPEIGYQYLSASMNALICEPTACLVAGTSIPNPGPMTLGNRNAYVLHTDLATGATRSTWLTDFPQGGRSETRDLRVVRVAPDRFAVLIAVRGDGALTTATEYRLIDASGSVLAAAKFPFVMATNSQPQLIGARILWIGPDGGNPGSDAYLYALDVTDPALPRMVG